MTNLNYTGRQKLLRYAGQGLNSGHADGRDGLLAMFKMQQQRALLDFELAMKFDSISFESLKVN